MTPRLIDTHLHLIHPDEFDYPWLSQVPALQHAFTLEDYSELTKDAGIEAALFMEVDVAESDSAREAQYFGELATSATNVLAGVIAAARPEHEGFAGYLDSLAGPRLKGIRRVLHTLDDSLSESATFRANIASLAARDLPFDLCILPRQQTAGLALVDACPQTTFVLDHCGNPNLSDPTGFAGWKKVIQAYAARPQVHAKLSGIVASAGPGGATRDVVHPYLDATLDAFGPDRLVWGSDWPVCLLGSNLPEWIALFREWLGRLSPSEQSRIASENAQRLYHL